MRLVTESYTVASAPGIHIYVRNTRPGELSTFRADRTLLFVHGADTAARTRIDDLSTPLEDAEAIGFAEAAEAMRGAAKGRVSRADRAGRLRLPPAAASVA